MDTRKLVDYAMDGEAAAFREELYGQIHDRISAAIEAKKQEIAQNLIAQEEVVEEEVVSEEEKHDDEKEDKALVKKMVKKDALKEEDLYEELSVKKDYDDDEQSEHGVYHGKKKIGYVVHDKKSGTHTAYHGHKYGKDDYAESDDFKSHDHAVKQIKKSAGLNEEESGLRMAAHAAHKSGKKSFEFQGKTYPVKVNEEEEEEKVSSGPMKKKEEKFHMKKEEGWHK